MASPVVFMVTKAQRDALVMDRRKPWPKWQQYRVFASLARKGLVEESKDRWTLTVTGLQLVHFLKSYGVGPGEQG
jgi:hypothetical protein